MTAPTQRPTGNFGLESPSVEAHTHAVVGTDNKPLGVLNAHDWLWALLTASNHEEALLRNYKMGIVYQ